MQIHSINALQYARAFICVWPGREAKNFTTSSKSMFNNADFRQKEMARERERDRLNEKKTFMIDFTFMSLKISTGHHYCHHIARSYVRCLHSAIGTERNMKHRVNTLNVIGEFNNFIYMYMSLRLGIVLLLHIRLHKPKNNTIWMRPRVLQLCRNRVTGDIGRFSLI